MIAYNEWHIFPNAIDKNICKQIIDLGDDDFESGKVGDDDKGEVAKDRRNSDVKWLANHRWLIDLLLPYIDAANESAGWKYDVRCLGGLQLTRYEEGGFYGWHRDGFGDHLHAQQYGTDPNKYVRKLSFTLLLNNDYEGGKFQFASYDKTECVISTPEMNTTGSIVIFPSVMTHRVTTVTKGTRYSLVGWFLGPPFR